MLYSDAGRKYSVGKYSFGKYSVGKDSVGKYSDEKSTPRFLGYWLKFISK
jgi:hypothetical protein